MTKRNQINVRSTVVIDAVLDALVDKTRMKKTDVIHNAIMQLAEKELSNEQLLELLKKQYL